MTAQLQGDVVGPPGAVAEGTPPETTGRAAPVSSLLREITRAMQTAAKRERERIDTGLRVEETAQVEKIQARATEEAAALRTGAEDDEKVVNAWYEDEIRRIREAADRRIEDRRRQLELSIAQHGSLIEAETESVHVAIQGYRESLGAFFGRLADEKDPSAIARLAGTLPEPPDLDEARADARSRAMQALEVEAAAEPATERPSSSDGTPPGAGGPVSIDELVPVMDTTAGQEAGEAGEASSTPGTRETAALAKSVALPPTRTWWLGRSAR